MFRRKKKAEDEQAARIPARDFDRLMRRVYRMVSSHRDSDAVCLLMDAYDYLQTRTDEFEALYRHVEQWGPSRTLLCVARVIIYRFDREKRHDRVLAYIEKCQQMSPRFVPPELSRVTFFARQAVAAGKLELAKNLVVDHQARYGDIVGGGECERLLQLLEPDIDLSALMPRN